MNSPDISESDAVDEKPIFEGVLSPRPRTEKDENDAFQIQVDIDTFREEYFAAQRRNTMLGNRQQNRLILRYASIIFPVGVSLTIAIM